MAKRKSKAGREAASTTEARKVPAEEQRFDPTKVNQLNPEAPLTTIDMSFLKNAVDEWAGNKGGLMPEEWPEFEMWILRARIAVARAKRAREILLRLREVVNETTVGDVHLLSRVRFILEHYK